MPEAITVCLGPVSKAVGARAGVWAARAEADVEHRGGQMREDETGAVGCRREPAVVDQAAGRDWAAGQP